MSFFDKLKQQRFLPVAILSFTLCVGILIGTVLSTGVQAARDGQSVAPDATPLVLPSPTQMANDFTKLAKQVEPSVVNISTDYTPKVPAPGRRNRPQQDEDDAEEPGDEQMDLFRRFFGGPGMRGLPNMPAPKRMGTGSGFIVDRNGYIITNYHVVEKADNIKVKLPENGGEFKAKLIGHDREIDMAVLKIDAGRALPVVKIANSEGVQVGDWAVAIGSPFGLEATVTAGIVSAKGRSNIAGARQFQSFIQTDAAINPGNSGGPLLNIAGEVIGINTAIATESGGYQGVGFALPINAAVKSYNSIIKTGKVTRGSIGVSLDRNEKPELQKALGVQGALLSGVEKDGPAGRAGLKPEDVITAINGRMIKDGSDLIARVSDLPVGETAKVTVDRGGKKLDFNVTIGDRNEVWARLNEPGERPEPAKSDEVSQAKFGMAIQNIGEGARKTMGLDDDRGVEVTRVDSNSFAEDIGVQERDVIVSINRQPVASVEDVRKIQASLKPGDPVALRVMRPFPTMRGGKPTYNAQYLTGTLPRQ